MSPASVEANDHDDVRAAASGDRHAFQRLYRLHVGRVHGAVLRLAGYDHARAEDLTQEAFIRAWQKLPGFRHESAFGTWLYRLAVNVALMDIRSRHADPVSMRRPSRRHWMMLRQWIRQRKRLRRRCDRPLTRDAGWSARVLRLHCGWSPGSASIETCRSTAGRRRHRTGRRTHGTPAGDAAGSGFAGSATHPGTHRTSTNATASVGSRSRLTYRE
jgi:DNA-directed RNA polymerase specialized sigma24 family protein